MNLPQPIAAMHNKHISFILLDLLAEFVTFYLYLYNIIIISYT